MANVIDIQELYHFKVQHEKDSKLIKAVSISQKIIGFQDTELFLKEIEQICKREDVVTVDIHATPFETLNLDVLASNLAKLAVKTTCKKIILPEKYYLMVRGKVKGLISKDIREAIGESIRLNICDNLVNTSDIINPEAFLLKIQQNNNLECIEATIKILNSIESYNMSSILACAIKRANKYVVKQRRVYNKVDCMRFGLIPSSPNEDSDDEKGDHDQHCGTSVCGDAPENNQKSPTAAFEDASTSSKIQRNISNIRRETKYTKRMLKCYVCKQCYSLPRKKKKYTPARKQFPRMCLPCAELNLEKRYQKVDLKGKYAVVTGGRIKIGYELVLKMLRDKCFVIVTTRFPHDATKRFVQEKDFAEWKDNLKVYPLDLKDVTGIFRFVNYVTKTVPYIDIIINNAAQTLRRPIDFYRNLLDFECIPRHHLRDEQQHIIASSGEVLNYGYHKQILPSHQSSSMPKIEEVIEEVQEDEIHIIDSRASLSCSDDSRDIAAEPKVCDKIGNVTTLNVANSLLDYSDSSTVINKSCDQVKTDDTDVITNDHKQSVCDLNIGKNMQIKSSEFYDSNVNNQTSTANGDDENLSVDNCASLLNSTDSNVVMNASFDETVKKPTLCGTNVIEALNDAPTKMKRNIKDSLTNQPLTKKQKCGLSPNKAFKRSISLDSYPESQGQNPDLLSQQYQYALSQQLQNQTGSVLSTPYSSGVIGHKSMSMNKSNQPNTMFTMSQYFPRGAVDDDGQQLDLRRHNSWRAVVDNVPLPELMEVLMINAVAPFILNKDLKPLLMKSPAKRKFIVNVSAMEGQFNRPSKTKFHPHTNMAKAALNMMTRTAALGYKDDNIFMTSVDTGWVSDERPLRMAKREQRLKGFRLPLDCVDGAARIYDPIVVGLSKKQTPHFAVFLKDYGVHPW